MSWGTWLLQINAVEWSWKNIEDISNLQVIFKRDSATTYLCSFEVYYLANIHSHPYVGLLNFWRVAKYLWSLEGCRLFQALKDNLAPLLSSKFFARPCLGDQSAGWWNSEHCLVSVSWRSFLPKLDFFFIFFEFFRVRELQ